MVALGLLTACGNGEGAPEQDAAAQETKATAFAEACSVTTKTDDAIKLLPTETLSGQVELKFMTNFGPIPMVLDADKAPCAATIIDNLAKQGYYNQTQCHRITNMNIYVLQCGDPTGTGTGDPGFSFADEYPVGTSETGLYKAGVVAMANAGADTNGSQFFLNYKDSALDPDYTIFGTITEEGMATLEKISAKGAAGGLPDGPPAEAVTIESAE